MCDIYTETKTDTKADFYYLQVLLCRGHFIGHNPKEEALKGRRSDIMDGTWIQNNKSHNAFN